MPDPSGAAGFQKKLVHSQQKRGGAPVLFCRLYLISILVVVRTSGVCLSPQAPLVFPLKKRLLVLYNCKNENAALSELAFEPIHILSEPMYIRFICDADGAREVAHRAVSVAWVPHPELVPGGARLSGEVGYGAPRRNAATHLKKRRHVLCQQADETSGVCCSVLSRSKLQMVAASAARRRDKNDLCPRHVGVVSPRCATYASTTRQNNPSPETNAFNRTTNEHMCGCRNRAQPCVCCERHVSCFCCVCFAGLPCRAPVVGVHRVSAERSRLPEGRGSVAVGWCPAVRLLLLLCPPFFQMSEFYLKRLQRVYWLPIR